MAKNTSKAGKKNNEEIFAGFQSLRNEQRQLGNKISELQMEHNEHKIVIDTLRGVELTRKCFRMFGGVLVERTVAEVLPELVSNYEQLPKAIQSLEEQLTAKGEEINKYIETHDIRIQRSDRAAPEPSATEPVSASTKSNVLVATG